MLRGSLDLPAAPAATSEQLSFACKFIVGIGVLNAVTKINAISKTPKNGLYLGTLAVIDGGTLYLMLQYCREGRTMEGLLKTVLLETILRSFAARIVPNHSDLGQ